MFRLVLFRMDIEGNIINLKDTASDLISVCFYDHVANLRVPRAFYPCPFVPLLSQNGSLCVLRRSWNLLQLLRAAAINRLGSSNKLGPLPL